MRLIVLIVAFQSLGEVPNCLILTGYCDRYLPTPMGYFYVACLLVIHQFGIQLRNFCPAFDQISPKGLFFQTARY